MTLKKSVPTQTEKPTVKHIKFYKDGLFVYRTFQRLLQQQVSPIHLTVEQEMTIFNRLLGAGDVKQTGTVGTLPAYQFTKNKEVTITEHKKNITII